MRKFFPLKGFITGLILQFAIGPVFIYILNISLQNGLINGLMAVLGVVVVDYLYIFLAILGAGKLLEKKKIRRIFSFVSSGVLIVFGIFILKKGILLETVETVDLERANLLRSFLSTFLLTVSNPLTIVFWTTIFTNKSIEYSLNRKELIIFGLSAGLATLVFLGTTVTLFSFLNMLIPLLVIRILNISVGIILIGFGLFRIIGELRKKEMTR